MKRFFAHISCIFTLTLTLFLGACDQKSGTDSSSSGPSMFEQIDPKQTGISFANTIIDSKEMNYLNFTYLYMSGGAGIGDFNNDGLPDVYFGATLGSNKLYLNKGNFQFEDISEKAGITAPEGIKTGVTVVDINGDGWLDIYQCRTGPTPEKRSNLLFINNKDLTFSEKSVEYGIDAHCASTHANFFDYDLDGDLDMYLLNHSTDFSSISNVRLKEINGKPVRQTESSDPYTSDRLYRNEGNGKFTNVSAQAGIDNHAFGLSVNIFDANLDGYPDMYVANDYVEPDILYINNKNGTFTDHLNDYVRHLCHFSMGADFGDLNNDGLLDLITLDMANPTNYKDKTNSTAMRNERYYQLAQFGYGEQLMRNTLQLNNGNGTYSDVACLAGIEATDWSWSPLFVDFDNDGWQDLFVSNGFRSEVQNMDFVQFEIDSTLRADGGKFRDTLGHIKRTPKVPIANYMFRNKGDLTFEDVSKAWGFDKKTISNAAVYADFDNDGDQDIIVVRCEEPAAVFRNKSVESKTGNYLQIKLEGIPSNPTGAGSTVKVTTGIGKQVRYANPTRGFISSSTDVLQFGLGKETNVKVQVQWPGGNVQTLENVTVNQRLVLKQADAKPGPPLMKEPGGKLLFTDASAQSGLNIKLKENNFFDFDRERLIPRRYSNLGPALAAGDVNGDGLDDLYIGGDFGASRYLCIQNAAGKFSAVSAPFKVDSLREDVGAAFFDADGDNDLDLYIVSGGNEPKVNTDYYQDRLYLNDGKGNMSIAKDKLPVETESGACVAPFDFDRDGDLDLFVGGRTVPGNYPKVPYSFVFQNNGGKFSVVTSTVAPEFGAIGMVTDIVFADLDKNGMEEMIVSCEWQAIEVFKFQNGKFSRATAEFGLDKVKGWWNTVVAADFDNDGDIDLAAGNEGMNTRYSASEKEPIRMYAKDFDGNGSIDPLMSWYWDGEEVPVALRDPMIKQLPELKKKFVRHHQYGLAKITDLFPLEQLKSGMVLETNELRSCYFENSNGKFTAKALPNEAQISPVKSMIVYDFDGNGALDLLVAGNDYGPAVEFNRNDAGNGALLLNDGKGNFRFVPNRDCGFWATKEVRHISLIRMAGGKKGVVVVNHADQTQLFRL
ncbi:MAG: VCBS repeat-containing protein [Saprospiraceae bacterium]|nr:VCBS repeat-containing protein [Saprospiraceae bacterium]